VGAPSEPSEPRHSRQSILGATPMMMGV